MASQNKLNTLNNALYGLGVIRILLIVIPQTGYIHPDEYFQSVEVLAAKAFDVEHNPPWEFNTTFPIRGMTIPYFTTGMCYIFLRDINYLALEYLSLNVVSPYFLIVVPRALMGLLSFIVDYCLYKICYNNNEKYKTRLIVLNTSYVMLVYSTRTFSNTTELIFFSLLLYFVSESQTFSNELLRKQEYIDYRYKKSTSLVEKAKFHKLRLYLVSDSYRNGLIIASIVVLGFFNRPTFIGFAVVPVFFWIYRGTGNKHISVTQFHTRILFFALCCIPAFIFNIIIDSFYYGYLTWGEIGMLDVSINNFVVTPLNFIRYNIQSSNLAKHGLHPRYLHVLINIPLLFNILGILALLKIVEYLYLITRSKINLLPSIKSIKMVMMMSFISPVFILSIFPHQEPRFLIPVIVPLVYLHGLKILPEPDNILVKVPELSIEEKNKLKINKLNYVFFKIWLIFNCLLLIFYGFIHQGGIYSSVNYLHKEIKLTPVNVEYNIITSNIYSFPESFLLQKATNKLYSNNNVKYSIKKRVYLHEEGSRDLLSFIPMIKGMVKTKYKLKSIQKSHLIKYKIYLLISSSLNKKIEDIFHSMDVSFKKLNVFGPHISIEAFPDFTQYCLKLTSIFYDSCEILTFWNYLKTMFALCQLNLYELDYENKSISIMNGV